MTPVALQRVVPFKPRTRKAPLPEEPECPTFWGYVRVSDPKQAQNTSTETQPEDIRKAFEEKWSRTHDWGGIVKDVASASKIEFRKRPGGAELLRKMRRGDVLVVAKLDRFSRNLVDGLTELRDLWQKGIRVVCLDMGGLTITFDGEAGEMYLTMLLWAAQFESKRKRDRSKESWRKIKEEIAAGKRDPLKRRNRSSVIYGTRPNPKDMKSIKKRLPAPEWRVFVRRLMALHEFACTTLGFSKCDGRHRWLAARYDLLWWPWYSKWGPQGDPVVIDEKQYIPWFAAEVRAQEREGKAYPPVDGPWREDWQAGRLIPPAPPSVPSWLKPINGGPDDCQNRAGCGPRDPGVVVAERREGHDGLPAAAGRDGPPGAGPVDPGVHRHPPDGPVDGNAPQ